MSQTDKASIRAYWDSFYQSRSSDAVPKEPSTFAMWVQPQLKDGQTIVELGLGNGRDALWFLGRGVDVLGFDFADSSIEAVTQLASAAGHSARFATLDLYDRQAVDEQADAITNAGLEAAIYGRFLIHSLQTDGRLNLIDFAARVLPGRGSLYLEFRTGHDKHAAHVFGDDHFRTYLEPEVVTGEIEARGGKVDFCESGYGLAPYRDEDPHIARVVASWSEGK